MSLPAYQFEDQNEEKPSSRVLELFDLEERMIQDVIMQGYYARNSCTLHHPKTYAGTAQWAETVRALRDKTVPLGWTTSDEKLFSLSVHPSNNLAIVVLAGNRETGTSGIPSNRAPKGPNTENAVAANFRQLSLFENMPGFAPGQENDDPTTWVLLHYVAPDEIRFELSLPLKIVGGKIRSWKERILFPAIPIGRQIDIEIGEDDGTEFDVPVQQR